MTRVIAIANEKGGVAKTTTTHTLGFALAELGKRVLLIDADAQGNLTAACGYDGDELAEQEMTISNVLAGDTAIEKAIVGENPALLGSNALLTDLNNALVKADVKPLLLRQYLQPLREHFDYVLIDCGPGITQATLNAFGAANNVLVPTKLDDRSVAGIKKLFSTIDLFTRSHNPRLRVAGILPTIYDKNYKSERDHLEDLKTHFAGIAPVFEPIPRTGWINNQVSKAKSILSSRPKTLSAKNYAKLAAEIEALGEQQPTPSKSVATADELDHVL